MTKRIRIQEKKLMDFFTLYVKVDQMQQYLQTKYLSTEWAITKPESRSIFLRQEKNLL